MSTVVPFSPEIEIPRTAFAAEGSPARHGLVLLLFWLVVFGGALASPPLLDDADATHAQAAQAMLRTGDWVTLHVNGVRYLEKAPLPYWIAACSLRIFGQNAFSIHLPLALVVLGLAALGYGWGRRIFGARTGFYTGLFVLTSVGPFLFTRIFIPEALLSLLLASGLYCLDRALHGAVWDGNGSSRESWKAAYLFWLTMALAVLTKGLIAIVFLLGTAALYFTLTRSWNRWRALHPVMGLPLFLLVAAPWHILAGVRNVGGANGHGFFWFYFVNEHVLRFLGRRIPRDYNKLPALWYWLLHLVWLFPWSFFAPVACVLAWRNRRTSFCSPTAAQQTVLLLCCFSVLVLAFFSLSTNQEYYTFPVYLPLLMLLAASVARARVQADSSLERAFRVSYACLAIGGILAASALAYGLWCSRHLPSQHDVGTLLGHRGVGGYTLSLSHFFDLTGPSFAALRLPATLALCSLGAGPVLAWLLFRARRRSEAVVMIAVTSALFLVAAHLALIRFSPVLSSSSFAAAIERMRARKQIALDTQIAIFGDQAFGSSIPFYLHERVLLVDGRSSSMLFGSSFPDAPPVFLSDADLAASWGKGARKILFVPSEQHEAASRLLGSQAIVLVENSGKELLTDRPLDPADNSQ